MISKDVENTAPKDVTNTNNDSVSNNKKDKKSVEKENRSPSTESPVRKGSTSSRKSRIEEVVKIKSIAVDKSAATAKKEFDLNANTEKVSFVLNYFYICIFRISQPFSKWPDEVLKRLYVRNK